MQITGLEMYKADEKLRHIEMIPFNSFKEKLKVVKEFEGKAYVEIIGNYVFVEMRAKDERESKENFKGKGEQQ